MLAVAFLAPSLAGRLLVDDVCEAPVLLEVTPRLRAGPTEADDAVDETETVDFREADVTVRGAFVGPGRVARPTTVGCIVVGLMVVACLDG